MIKVIERREQEFIPNIILLKLEIPLVKHNSWMLPEVKDYGKGEGGGGGSLSNLFFIPNYSVTYCT